MNTINHILDPETYVLCEKAAKAAGKKTVEEWLSFLISENMVTDPTAPAILLGFAGSDPEISNSQLLRK